MRRIRPSRLRTCDGLNLLILVSKVASIRDTELSLCHGARRSVLIDDRRQANIRSTLRSDTSA